MFLAFIGLLNNYFSALPARRKCMIFAVYAAMQGLQMAIFAVCNNAEHGLAVFIGALLGRAEFLFPLLSLGIGQFADVVFVAGSNRRFGGPMVQLRRDVV